MLTVIDTSKFFTVLTNTLINSIPEDIFLTMFCLTLLKEFDFLESKVVGQNRFKKVDIADISVPVLYTAVITNLLRYLGVKPNVLFLLSASIMFISILIKFKRYSDAEAAFKTLVCTASSFILLFAVEHSYIPLVLHATNKTLGDFYNSVPLYFLLTLPGRFIEFALISYLLLFKSKTLKLISLKQVLESKISRVLAIAVFSGNLILFFVIGTSIVYYRILAGFSLMAQTVQIIIILMLPLINSVIFIYAVWNTANNEYRKTADFKRQFKAGIGDINMLVEQSRYGKISSILSYMEKDIEKMS